MLPPYFLHQDFLERTYHEIKVACAGVEYDIDDEEKIVSSSIGPEKLRKWFKENVKNKKSRPTSKMFMKLFKYISGENQQKQEMPMTVPVLSEIFPVSESLLKKEMCFYIPKKFQENTPDPVDPDVWVETAPEVTVYVKQFGGYVMQDIAWIKHANDFKKELKAMNLPFEDKFYITASYNGPWVFKNRKNEVMFQKKP